MLLPRRTRAVVAAVAVLLLSASACSGGGGSNEADLTPDKVLAQAKNTLDETSGVQLTLSTDDLPDGITGIEKASGVGTHAPAFDGTIDVVLSGTPFQVPVIAVDDTVWAQLPLTPGWQDLDPTEYGAPDPAQLMNPDAGFSSLLSSTDGVKKGDSVRGGKDNDEVLTEYTGTVPASAVKNVIPGASGQFDATYTITDDSELRRADLTGVFYEGSDSMTYSITFDDYGTEKKITAP
jgi:lipoprotein LprG